MHRIITGTLFLLLCGCTVPPSDEGFQYSYGAIVRGDIQHKRICLVFTADEYGEGGSTIAEILKIHKIPGSFFLTGNFYRNPLYNQLIKRLANEGHYLGAHSDQHLLYCDWGNRDSLLVIKEQFMHDLKENYRAMIPFGISKQEAPYFLPPYEWHNDSISWWTRSMELQLINMTPGTLSHADYTLPGDSNYRSSKEIYESILTHERESTDGLNGFILLIHLGTAPERTDKFYNLLPELILALKERGYDFFRIDSMLKLR
jgi:peptidoglycan/xylan/chitin deacetylase (PgdA/CDA1 family)